MYFTLSQLVSKYYAYYLERQCTFACCRRVCNEYVVEQTVTLKCVDVKYAQEFMKTSRSLFMIGKMLEKSNIAVFEPSLVGFIRFTAQAAYLIITWAYVIKGTHIQVVSSYFILSLQSGRNISVNNSPFYWYNITIICDNSRMKQHTLFL